MDPLLQRSLTYIKQHPDEVAGMHLTFRFVSTQFKVFCRPNNIGTISCLTPLSFCHCSFYCSVDVNTVTPSSLSRPRSSSHNPTNHTCELVSGGSNIPVTARNRQKYVAAHANFVINTSVELQSRAFYLGLCQVSIHIRCMNMSHLRSNIPTLNTL